MADRRRPREARPRPLHQRCTLRAVSRSERIAAWFGHRRGGAGGAGGEGAAALLDGARFTSAQALLSAFYGVLFFFAAGSLFTWQDLLGATELLPRWPVFWLSWAPPGPGIAFILWTYLLGGLVGVTLSRYRWARIVVFVTLLQFLALRFSFGSVNHGDHMGVLLSFVLIFLPAGWRGFPDAPRRVRAATLVVFSGAQAMLLLIYSMAGWWKAFGVVRHTVKGEVSYLWPQGLATLIADKLLAADATSLAGAWLVEHYWVGWPLMLAAIYLEFFSLWVVARPSLHQAWGVALIGLHLSTHLTMGVGFPQNILWLALFLVASPLRPREPDWRRAVGDLPLLGRWLPGRRGRSGAAVRTAR